MKRFLSSALRLFSSYGMACVILVLLALLTYLGTIAQVEMGIFQAQKIYFESFIVMQPLPGGLALPLPGVALLLTLFSINILLGGIMRLRRKPGNFGLFIVHGGILFLLFGGLVTWVVGYDGQMTLAPGQQSSRFQSYHEWELAVVDPSPADRNLEYLIPESDLKPLGKGGRLEWSNPELPFTLEAWGYAVNARVMPKGPMFEAPTEVVEGFFVQPLARDLQQERNMPAVYLDLIDKQTGEKQREILWGNSLQPLTVHYGGKPYTVELRHRTWTLPFAIKLNKFTREFHPGTQQPRTFQSAVLKLDHGGEQPIVIRMNEPLRDSGYVFFQASYIEDPRTGQLSSTLAVTRNPADQFPLYACVIITLGMLVHFGLKLSRYLRKEREQQA